MTQTPSHFDRTPDTATEPLVGSGGDARFPDDSPPAASLGLDYTGGAATSGGDESVQDTAKNEAGKVADTGVQAAKDVAGTAKVEASNVVAETKEQAKSLFESARGELQSQGGAQQQRLASSLHSLAQELGGMASGSQQSGPLTDLAKQAAAKGGEVAHWLETHEPADLLREVQTFARRRPVAFLALCGLAGVVAGRIARGATAANSDLDSGSANDRRAANPPADFDGAGLGYSDLLASTPDTRSPGDQLGTRYGDPAREAYDAGLGTSGTEEFPYDTASTRPGGA